MTFGGDGVARGACNRKADDVVLSNGNYGACDYANACAETGTKTRTNRVCVRGVEDRPTSRTIGFSVIGIPKGVIVLTPPSPAVMGCAPIVLTKSL